MYVTLNSPVRGIATDPAKIAVFWLKLHSDHDLGLESTDQSLQRNGEWTFKNIGISSSNP